MTGGAIVRCGRRRTWLGVAVLILLTALWTAPVARAETASWSFDPSSWDFGVVVPGSGLTPPKVFTLTNTGGVELSISLVAIGSEEGDFLIAENKCGKLTPGASCTISVTFNPSTAGPKDGQLSVASQGGLAPQASRRAERHGRRARCCNNSRDSGLRSARGRGGAFLGQELHGHE